MAQRATIDGVGWILSMLFFDLLLCHFHRYGSFRFLYVFSLAKVKRLVAMPSTGRKLPISEKFGKAQGHFLLAQDTKQNQNFIRNSLAKATLIASL